MIKQVVDSAKSALQAFKGTDNTSNKGPLQTVEMAKANAAEVAKLPQEARWTFVGGTSIDGARWNKSYPYQLMILDAKAGYKPVHVFTLPIPPTDLQVSTPFAIEVSATLGGIVEEHNGAPFRMISFSGTTGILPLRGIGEVGRNNVLAGAAKVGVLAGTVNAVERVADRTKSLLGKGASQSNLVAETLSGNDAKGTGYYQFRLLQKFLEGYVAMKKQERFKHYRLGLAIWKDQAVYLVTPQQFDVRRAAQSPLEYTYSLSFKAWRRVSPSGKQPKTIAGFQAVTSDPSVFASVINTIEDARRVLEGARGVLVAFNGDVQRLVFEPMREIALFGKDFVGLAVAASDFPANIVTTFKDAVLEAREQFDWGSWDETVRNRAVETNKPETGSGNLSTSGSGLASEFDAIFANPTENYDFMSRIKPSSLNLPLATQRQIAEERRRVQALTRLDFEKYRDQIEEFAVAFADSVGAGHDTFNQQYRRSSNKRKKAPTDSDFEALYALNQTIMELNRLAADSDEDRLPTTIESIAGMASAAGIAFQLPVSKFPVPFPYGSTLEQLAARYLGDPNRWMEIAALNGLQTPYVDEEGFELPLLVNGTGNTVYVSDATNLFIGQAVWISSRMSERTKRTVTKIQKMGNGMVQVGVDGDPDMGNYSTLAAAKLEAFLPHTVNSQQLIYIPSDEEIEDDPFFSKSIPGVDQLDPLIRVGGVDLLLDSKGDLVVTPDGDCRLATGLTNLIQRIKLALATPKGSLIHHPEYGMGISAGMSTADADAEALVAAIQDMFANDPAFTAASSVSIYKSGPVLRVSMSVGIAGTDQNIPVSIDIRR